MLIVHSASTAEPSVSAAEHLCRVYQDGICLQQVCHEAADCRGGMQQRAIWLSQ